MTAVNIDSLSIRIDSLTVRIDTLEISESYTVLGGGVGSGERVPYWRRVPWLEDPWPDEVDDPLAEELEAEEKRRAEAERKRRLEARMAEIREEREQNELRATSRNKNKRYGDRFSAAMALLERQGWKTEQ